MSTEQILFHPFTLGLALGLIFTAIALYEYLRLKGEMKHYKRHLSDKLQIEAASMTKMNDEQQRLRKENENLRVKIASMNETPDRKTQRDLEIFARAEKRMLVSVPGFAPVWDNAKNVALAEVEEEDSGRSISKRVFTKFFGTARKEETVRALPDAESP